MGIVSFMSSDLEVGRSQQPAALFHFDRQTAVARVAGDGSFLKILVTDTSIDAKVMGRAEDMPSSHTIVLVVLAAESTPHGRS
jgi:hypothetical protein